MFKISHTGLLSFSLICFITFANLLESAELKLGNKDDYSNRETEVVYGNKNASYITKTSSGYAFIDNGRKSETYKNIEMLTYGDSKDSYAYIGVDSKNTQNIVFNGKRIRHTMDKIIGLSASDKTFVYVGQKDKEYFVYLNTKKIFETKNEITSAMLLENGSYLLSVKDGSSYKILLNTKEIATSEQPAEFTKHKKYTIVLHSDSKSANNKTISITDSYKKLETFDMVSFDGFNRIGNIYTSLNEKSYVMVAYKTSSQNATIIANDKIATEATKLNRVLFSPNGLRYLLDVNKSNGSYVVGDDDEFGPYNASIIDMAFSADSLLWGFLGRNGIRTMVIVDSEAITSYHYAGNIVLSKDGDQWIIFASNGGNYFLDFYNTTKYEPSKMYEFDKIYTVGISDSTKRIGLIYDDDEGNTRIYIDDEVLEYNASKKYPFMVVTDKSYMSIIENDDKYALMLNGKSIAKFDDIFDEPMYCDETSDVYVTYLDGDDVYLYTTNIK